MKYGALFSPIGTLKQRGRNYYAVLDDLRVTKRRDQIRRLKSKREIHVEHSNAIRQTGATP